MEGFSYRDKHLDRVKVAFKIAPLSDKPCICVRISFAFPTETKGINVCFNDVTLARIIQNSPRKGKDEIEDGDYEKLICEWKVPFHDIAKYLIIWDRFDKYKDNTVDVDTKPKPEFPAYLKDGDLAFTRGERLRIEQNRIARRLALKIAYESGEAGISIIPPTIYSGPELVSPKEDEIHFPADVFYDALRVLESAEFLRFERDRDRGSFYCMTLKGQLKYEEAASFQDKAFIIASCNEKMKPIVKLYKDILAEDQFNFEGIFQEDEEPEKSIHIDIFDYIQNVPLIIADLTGHRRNCYLELGYAMALNKRIILALNEEDHYDPKTGKELLAFDTTPMKYTFYRDTKELEEKIRERIAVNLEMIRKVAEI